MNPYELQQQLTLFSRAVAELRRRVQPLIEPRLDDGGDGTEPAAALAESLEALGIAEEELRQQSEELLSTRGLLEAERDRYHELFDAALDAYILTDLSGIIQDANQAAVAMWGDMPANVPGKPLAIYIAPGGRRAFRSTLDRLNARRWDEQISVPLAVRVGGGGEREVVLRARLIGLGQGQEPRVWWVLRDISERERAEAALAIAQASLASELNGVARLRAVGTHFADPGDLSAVLDEVVETAVAITHADAGILQLHDPLSGQLTIVASIGHGPAFLRHFATVVAGRAACGVALQCGERVVVEDVSTSPVFAGTPDLPVMLAAGVQAVQSTPLVSARGRVIGVLSTHYRHARRPEERNLRLLDLLAHLTADSIGRIWAEDARRESEERFRTLVQAVAQAVWETDAAGVMVVDSPSWRAYTGQSESEWLGHGWLDAIHPDDRAGAEQQWREAVRDRTPMNGEFRLHHVSGGWHWTNVRATALLNPDGSIRKWMGMNIDITVRKQAEQERERLFDAETQARQEAEHQTELRLRFLGMISHELRTPLTSIKGFATTLLAEDVAWDVDSTRDFLRTIDVEADKLAEMIDQLLDLSRLEAGSLRVNPRPTVLGDILTGVWPQLHALATEHPFTVQLPGDLRPVRADGQRICQVLVNLVSNAAKYSPPDTPIAIAATQAGDWIQVSVSDQGHGIRPEDRAHLFEAFRRGEDEGVRRTKGAGLGLAICKGLIEAHGGRIWIEERPGPGTTVCFTLPVSYEG